jgi:two-component system, NarL family, response regulator NreC
MTIRVLIVDDHEVVAEGLSHMLARCKDIEVLGIARSGREAVRRAVELDPDVILMDSSMEDLNGIEAARLIRERGLRSRIVMLSVHSEPLHVVRALRAGASGYVPKSSAGSDVVEAIRAVNSGQRYVHPSIASGVLSQLVESEADDDPLRKLSSRERQVLQLIAEGKAVADIAERLSLSARTVETYRARLMYKLDIHDVPSLVKLAIRHGLTSL